VNRYAESNGLDVPVGPEEQERPVKAVKFVPSHPLSVANAAFSHVLVNFSRRTSSEFMQEPAITEGGHNLNRKLWL
jgi:hypothetical protein